MPTKAEIAAEMAAIAEKGIAVGAYVEYTARPGEGKAGFARVGRVTDVRIEDKKMPMVEYTLVKKDGTAHAYKNRPSLLEVVDEPARAEE